MWNCARTLEYVRKYMPQRYRYLRDCCPDISGTPPPVNPDNPTADDYLFLPYDNPVADNAWWYDSARPESAGFFGFQIVNIEGRFSNTREVEILQGAGCSVTNRYQVGSRAQILTIEAAAYGLSCCSISYGIRALRHLLSGCGCDDSCKGTQLTLYDCDPNSTLGDANASICIPPGDGFQLPVESGSPWRMLTNAKLIEMPEVLNQRGQGCGSCGCGEYTTVRFTIATDPGAYLENVVLVPERLIIDGECQVGCDVECRDPAILQDPLCPTPLFVSPGDSAIGCFCPPLIRYENCFEFNLQDRLFITELEFAVRAGNRPLRNLEVRVWNKFSTLGYETGIYTNCNTCAGFTISYIPQGAVLERTVCGANVNFANNQLNAATVLSGPTGGGDACVRLSCGEYIVCVLADSEYTSDTATLEISSRVWEP